MKKLIFFLSVFAYNTVSSVLEILANEDKFTQVSDLTNNEVYQIRVHGYYREKPNLQQLLEENDRYSEGDSQNKKATLLGVAGQDRGQMWSFGYIEQIPIVDFFEHPENYHIYLEAQQ